MEHIEIRPMRREDLYEVERIERTNFSTPWRLIDFAGYLADKNAIFLAASGDGGVVGYIGAILTDYEGDITNVSVRPDRMHRGIGTMLLGELLSRIDARGVARMFLEVRQSNAHAIRLYSEAGFVCVGTRKNYYRLPDEDAIVMARDRMAGGPDHHREDD
ncbi:MAG: ribosomal protein S18-alanine N-acetyltransferase [Lachnospiraceae bacterium]|jgi:ribosomal-protein-alanine N-acetyltransferase|nr:ribosomal protein S18-alanine N-acetyltransferase [Lachnospiraceae bacterium]